MLQKVILRSLKIPIIPNLFILGAPKSGTTALASQLSAHIDIYMGTKEPRYFDAHVFYDYECDYPIKSINAYLDIYSSKESENARYSLDASVFNMYSELSIKNILALSPNAKFIIVLRDPLSASKSMHLQRLKYVDTAMREISTDFDVCWNSLTERAKGNKYPKGCRNKFLFRYDLLYSYNLYLPYIEKLIQRENLIVIDYSVYRSLTKLVHQEILNFLDLNKVDLPISNANTSYAVDRNIVSSAIDFAARSSFHFRSKLGLTGDNLTFLRNLQNFFIRKKAVKQTASDLDREINEFFLLSCKAKADVCEKYSVNKRS